MAVGDKYRDKITGVMFFKIGTNDSGRLERLVDENGHLVHRFPSEIELVGEWESSKKNKPNYYS